MDQTPIVSLAGGHPLIDFDGTVVVQLVLFLVLFAIANRFLFQPYLQLRERRKAGIEGARAEADRMTAQADAKLADYEKQLASARNRANEEGAAMRRETEAARAQLMPQAESLARAISSKLLGREVA
jgi:F-type H+-transporting ATPase subunit b